MYVYLRNVVVAVGVDAGAVTDEKDYDDCDDADDDDVVKKLYDGGHLYQLLTLVLSYFVVVVAVD